MEAHWEHCFVKGMPEAKIWGCQDLRVSENQGPRFRPQIEGLVLEYRRTLTERSRNLWKQPLGAESTRAGGSEPLRLVPPGRSFGVSGRFRA